MSAFLHAARAKTGQRVTIRFDAIATLTETRHNTCCIVSMTGDVFHLSSEYGEVLELLEDYEKKETASMAEINDIGAKMDGWDRRAAMLIGDLPDDYDEPKDDPNA